MDNTPMTMGSRAVSYAAAIGFESRRRHRRLSGESSSPTKSSEGFDSLAFDRRVRGPLREPYKHAVPGSTPGAPTRGNSPGGERDSTSR